MDIMEDILQFIENLDCEEINELNEEGLLNNNIALQADINGKDIHFELRMMQGKSSKRQSRKMNCKNTLLVMK